MKIIRENSNSISIKHLSEREMCMLVKAVFMLADDDSGVNTPRPDKVLAIKFEDFCVADKRICRRLLASWRHSRLEIDNARINYTQYAECQAPPF